MDIRRSIVLLAAILAAACACSSDGDESSDESYFERLRAGTPVPFPSITPQPTPEPTSTMQPYTYSPENYGAKLASCGSAPNGSWREVSPTTRLFITLPRRIYQGGDFVTLVGDANGGYISNGGLPGYAFEGSTDCWSTYYEVFGEGETEFRAPAVVPGAPEYRLRFVVRSRDD